MEGNEVSHLPGIAVTNDLDLDVLSEDGLENALDKILIHPSLHLAHPNAVREENYGKVRGSKYLPEGLGRLVGGRHRGSGGEVLLARSVHARAISRSAGGAGSRIFGHFDCGSQLWNRGNRGKCGGTNMKLLKKKNQNLEVRRKMMCRLERKNKCE